MPLHPGTSRATFSENVSEMMHAGHPQDQALAAAFREKRASRAMGGGAFPGLAGPGAFPGPQAGLGTLAQMTSPQAAPGRPMGMPMPGLGGVGGIKPFGMADGGDPTGDDSDYYGTLARDLPAELSSPRQWTPEDTKAMGAAFADPFGIPSSIAKTVAPEFGQNWKDLESANPQGAFAGAMMEPGSVASLPFKGLGMAYRAARAYPKAAATVAGLGALTAPATAGEKSETPEKAAAPPPTGGLTPDEQKQIDDLKQQVAEHTKNSAAAEKAARDQVNAARAADLKKIRKPRADWQQAAYQTQVDSTNASYDKQLADAVASAKEPFAKPLADANDAITGINQTVTKRLQANAPFAQRMAGTNVMDLLSATPSVSLATGYLLGRYLHGKYPHMSGMQQLGQVGGGALVGAGEGAIAGGYPAYADSKFPEESAAYKDFERKTADFPHYVGKDIAPEALMGAFAGGLGTKYGMMGPVSGILAPNIYRRLSGEAPKGIEAAAPAAEAAGSRELTMPGHGSAPTTAPAEARWVGSQAPVPQIEPPGVAAGRGRKQWPANLSDVQWDHRSDGIPYELGTGHPLPRHLRDQISGVHAPAANAEPAEANGGGIGAFAFGGTPPMSQPYARMAERSISHTGPVIGSSLGRGDSKSISVPGGSYVLPASHVSALGQGNTLAGHSILNQMFSGGPFGTMMPKGGRGAGPPRPPRGGGFAFAEGGNPQGHGEPVPIMISDGEHVLSPEEVAMFDRITGGSGDVDEGHKLLDEWVIQERKKHVKELKSLPGPAQ